MFIDESGRHAGRGAYLCADGACWRHALEKGALQHALGIPLPADLRVRLEAGPQPAEAAARPATQAIMSDQGGTRGQE